MKKIGAVLLSTAVLLSSVVCCADEKITCYYDAASSSIKISGNFGSTKGNAVTFTAINHKNRDSMSKDCVPSLMFLYTTSEGGALAISEPVSDNLESGRYDILLDGKSENYESYILYVNDNDSETKNAVKRINEAKNAEDIRKILLGDESNEPSADKLGIDTDDEITKKYIDGFIGACIDIKNSLEEKAFTPSTFLKSFSAYLSIRLINDGDVDYALSYYSSYYGTTYEEYSGYDAKLRKELNKILEKTDFDIGSLEADYKNAYILANIKISEDWLTLSEIIEKYSVYLKINLSDLNDIASASRYKVYMKMLNTADKFENTDDVKTAFEKYVKEVYNEESKGGSGSAGGGRSSGGKSPSKGGSTPVTVPEYYNPQDKSGISFTDTENCFARDYINVLANKKIINGYSDGTFKPNENITRAEFAKMIKLLFEIDSESKVYYGDVSDGDWFKEYVDVLSGAGIINGFEGRFNPSENITRQDAAVICKRVSDYLKKPMSGEKNFADDSDISDYAKESVSLLGANGILQGDGSGFKPLSPITRAETAALLCRLSDNLK